jgi:hypothetical protein
VQTPPDSSREAFESIKFFDGVHANGTSSQGLDGESIVWGGQGGGGTESGMMLLEQVQVDDVVPCRHLCQWYVKS